MKKFIFSKVASLHAYSRQPYQQMNSFTGIFQTFYVDLKNVIFSPSDIQNYPSVFTLNYFSISNDLLKMAHFEGCTLRHKFLYVASHDFFILA